MDAIKKILITAILLIAIISITVIFFATPRVSPIKYWGAFTGNTAESFAEFERIVGTKADINVVFTGWNDKFPVNVAESLKKNGKILVLFWEPQSVTLDQIVTGFSDEYIKQFALDARLYGAPVILVPFPEMNGNWDTWDGAYGSNTPAQVILAWKHVHDLFLGVTNVKFGWDINNNSVPDTPVNAMANYYPGSEYVDYVGVDGFNFGNPWQTYSDIFSSALQKIRKYKKPIYIFSMACAEGPRKNAWITDALSEIKSDRDIVGFIWFNQKKEQNWPVDSSQSALKAFKSAVK